jgi:hypothetical protein
MTTLVSRSRLLPSRLLFSLALASSLLSYCYYVVVVAATSAGKRSSLCCCADLRVLHHLSIYFIAKLGLGFSFSQSEDTRSYREDTFFIQCESATTTTACIFEQSDDGFVRKGGQKQIACSNNLWLWNGYCCLFVLHRLAHVLDSIRSRKIKYAS